MEIQRRLYPSPRSIRCARLLVRFFAAEVPRNTLQDAELLVSEMVTNCLSHAGTDAGPIEVGVGCFPDHLRIEVSDCGSGFEPTIPPQPRPDLMSGWGLFLVDRVAQRWGVSSSKEGGALVWAELGWAEEPRARRLAS